jgi:hypothetical protein
MARKCDTATVGRKQKKNAGVAARLVAEGKGQLVLDREELVAMMQDCLTTFATEVGLKIAYRLLEEEAQDLGAVIPPEMGPSRQ